MSWLIQLLCCFKCRIRWSNVAEKAAAVFGCVFLLTVTSEEFIIPVVCGNLSLFRFPHIHKDLKLKYHEQMKDASVALENASTISESALILLESISLLPFPFMVTFLLGLLPLISIIL
jgi:sterol O-acyltransferase